MTLSLSRLKFIIWSVFVVVGIIASVIGIRSISSLYGYFERAREVDSALILSKPRQAEEGFINWLTEYPAVPRQLEPYTRDGISQDYLLAFEELSYSHLTGDTSGLSSYFQEGALDDVLLAISSAKKAQFIDWDHQLELHFYAPDGATVGLTDSYLYAQAVIEDNDLLDIRIARRKMDAVLVLGDGNWRIHHWRVLEDEVLETQSHTNPNLSESISNMRGMNYIARSAPFNSFWPNFNAAEVDLDFATTAKLGLNTIRFFIPYPAPEGLYENLPKFIELAEKHDLQLIPTLLDTYTTYRLEDLPKVQVHFKKLMSSLSHPNVLAIDLKNEADFDLETAGLNRSRAFLSYMLRFTQALSQKPVFIGFAKPDPVLAQEVDIISLHHYDSAPSLSARITKAQRYNKPILLEEFGFHSWSLKLPDPHSEAEQAWYYQNIFNLTGSQNVGWLIWTLHDLPKGQVPNNRAVERYLGVIKADGTYKEVISVIQGKEASPVSRLQRLIKFRWLILVSVLSLAALILIAVLMYRFTQKRYISSSVIKGRNLQI